MNNETNYVIYQTDEVNTKIEARLAKETVWRTQTEIRMVRGYSRRETSYVPTFK
ncbi:hypothetical protein KHA93_16870 [Bacillus sp. FJAT-49732]|uniref:Uncharacterized protein n=1 Tax=Lederbergia citrisecunda TaxID=2833583 RepID=A0A942TN19_9BACI|nr:hypothetical protein [Lederbergia citrisecunda]MBS4201311.1 hypothetical protein [Lederbergia citrisecunda]